MRPRSGFLVALLATLVAFPLRAIAQTEPLCFGEVPTIVGTSGMDVLVGTSGRDVFLGLDGNDTIVGRHGNDILCGDGGDDRLIGGSGDDILQGDTDTFGDDVLIGGRGNDRLSGQLGDDLLLGGSGNDELYGGDADDEYLKPGEDKLVGGGGNDVLFGGPGLDELSAGRGDDRLYGGGDADLLHGNTGDDELVGDSGDDEVHGGRGADKLFGADGSDTLYGDPGDDALFGGYDDDDLFGGRGDDELFGEEGEDRLFGGPGDDLMDGGPGDDEFNGGPGDDLQIDEVERTLAQLVDLGDRTQIRDWAALRSIAAINADVAALDEAHRNRLAEVLLDSNATGAERDRFVRIMQGVLAHPDLGFYAEIWSYTFVELIPGGFFGGCGHLFLDPGAFGSLTDAEARSVLMHESFHSFNCTNGGPVGSLDEGSAIWISKVSFPGAGFLPGESWAEATYGSKLYHKEFFGNPNLPLVAPISPTPKLLEVYAWLAANDPSLLPWNSTDRLVVCFDRYFAHLNRNVDFFTVWLPAVEDATRNMLADAECQPL
jgi:hemolysin type calcium-binding protein